MSARIRTGLGWPSRPEALAGLGSAGACPSTSADRDEGDPFVAWPFPPLL